MTVSAMGHIVLKEPKPKSGSVLDGATREGFTAHAARFFQTFIPADEVSTEAVQAYQRRCDLLATVAGVKQSKANRAIRSASVSRN